VETQPTTAGHSHAVGGMVLAALLLLLLPCHVLT
jgi:hypothetical protein